MKCTRLDIAAKILAGLSANTFVIGYNSQYRWGVVNCTTKQLASFAVHLADELIAEEKASDSSAPVAAMEDKAK